MWMSRKLNFVLAKMKSRTVVPALSFSLTVAVYMSSITKICSSTLNIVAKAIVVSSGVENSGVDIKWFVRKEAEQCRGTVCSQKPVIIPYMSKIVYKFTESRYRKQSFMIPALPHA